MLSEGIAGHKISYCDAISVAVMKQMNIDEVFAFDRHFEMMGVIPVEQRLGLA